MISRIVVKRLYSTKIDKKRIRNIGIIAHVDAGKTTVTERLLYLAGAINVAGNVDKGTTVTDYLDIERERGITVQSAAVNLDWLNHRLNLIDTPGHVDFKVEVERCVRVLDGIVCVIDGSAGVQPQTLTVWHQSMKFQLPAIFFINKLDKKEGNFEMSVDSIEQKLGVKAIRTAIPYIDGGGQMRGIVDLVEGKWLDLSGGDVNVQWSDVKPSTHQHDLLTESRNEMCYSIADHDPDFLAHFLDEHAGDHTKVQNSKIIETLRNLTNNGQKIATVSCGSAIKSLHCVKPILDSVVNFFPSPDMRNQQFQQVFGDDLSGLVFKITHDKRRGQLSYIRIYTGKLTNNTSIYNSTQMASEGPVKVFTPYADELKPVDGVEWGNIAVVSGLANTVTGDTVLLSHSAGEKAFEKLKTSQFEHLEAKTSHDGASVLFSGIETPEPVFFCCIEPPSNKQMQLFNRALDELTREDPSMKIRFDKDTGQTIVETQGELHMEAVKDRLKRGYGLDVFVGELQVAYRELLTEEIVHTCKVEDKMSEKKKLDFASLTMKLTPTEGNVPFKRIELDLPPLTRCRPDWQKAINEGCQNALQNGPLAAFPIQSIRISLTDLVVSGGKVNPAILSACAQKCVSEALVAGEVVLIEPLMEVQIDVRNKQPTQGILNELMKRRARISNSDSVDESTVRITASMPLSETQNLSKLVRTMTSGFGEICLQIQGYQEVPDFERNTILKNKTRNFDDY